MPGYSGTPLAKKLGIKAGLCVSFVDMPADVRAELKDSIEHCTINSGGKLPHDFLLWFAKSKADLNDFDFVSSLLSPAGMIWVSWPKKSSGVSTDLTENIVREIGLTAGLVDVKVCAITDIWSGLKFVRRLKDR